MDEIKDILTKTPPCSKTLQNQVARGNVSLQSTGPTGPTYQLRIHTLG